MRNPGPASFLIAFLTVGWLSNAASPATADDCIVLENFADAKVGEFPAAWKVRYDSAKPTYKVEEADGARFLRARSVKLGYQAARQVDWDLAQYPILVWRWRPIEFPKGSDERESSRNDSALAVYMLVDYSRIRGPQAVKYVWSESVPTGTQLESNLGLTKVRVLRTGGADKGKWIEERVDVRADFMKAFEVKEVPKPAGIAVLTDADDTESTAAGDYGDVRACRK